MITNLAMHGFEGAVAIIEVLNLACMVTISLRYLICPDGELTPSNDFSSTSLISKLLSSDKHLQCNDQSISKLSLEGNNFMGKNNHIMHSTSYTSCLLLPYRSHYG